MHSYIIITIFITVSIVLPFFFLKRDYIFLLPFILPVFICTLPVLAAAPDIPLPPIYPVFFFLYFYILISFSYVIYEGSINLFAIHTFIYHYLISNERLFSRICFFFYKSLCFLLSYYLLLLFFITHLSSLQLQTSFSQTNSPHFSITTYYFPINIFLFLPLPTLHPYYELLHLYFLMCIFLGFLPFLCLLTYNIGHHFLHTPYYLHVLLCHTFLLVLIRT